MSNSVTDLTTLAYAQALTQQAELHEVWISQSHKLTELAGVAHLITSQSNARLDLLLRQLEAEWEPNTETIDFLMDLRFSLSECWVLRAYELIRSAAQQLRARGEINERVSALKHRLGLVRMPIAKAEIQQANKTAEPIMLTYEGGTGAGPYEDDGSYVMPRAVCTATGSAMWWPVDLKTGHSAEIRRIDLSNEMLSLLD